MAAKFSTRPKVLARLEITPEELTRRLARIYDRLRVPNIGAAIEVRHDARHRKYQSEYAADRYRKEKAAAAAGDPVANAAIAQRRAYETLRARERAIEIRQGRPTPTRRGQG